MSKLSFEKSNKMKKAKIIVGITLAIIFLAMVISPQKAFVISMIIGGRIVSPEGSDILFHYCFGNGDTLNVNPKYISKSPVVLRSMKGLKIGEVKKVIFKQSEDWRLSYALNPFNIRREKDSFLIYQYIVFSKSSKIYTDLNLGFTKIRVYDNIVHVFDCKPFVAVCKFKME